MKIKTTQLISELVEQTRQNMNQVEKFKQHADKDLHWRPDPESWNVLECIEHLNLYGAFYLPEIERRIKQAVPGSAPVFKSGWLGNYFANAMKPGSGMKIKTFKDKNTLNQKLDKSTLDTFLLQQNKLLNYLDMSRNVNLNKVSTSISISAWIKLKLGDTFRFLINHNERHIVQAKNVLQKKEKR